MSEPTTMEEPRSFQPLHQKPLPPVNETATRQQNIHTKTTAPVISVDSPSDPLKRPSVSETMLRQNPKSRSQAATLRIFILIGHVLLTLAPVMFLLLAIMAYVLDRRPLSGSGDNVLQAAKLAPTIFPIIFAAVVGRLMRTFARWRAEKGARLGLLEQLHGSQNLIAAIERAWVLQGFALPGFLVVALWALSPVGGQSSLRVLSTTSADIRNTTDVWYFDTSNYTVYSGFSPQESRFGGDASTVSIYRAAILSANRTTVTDPWGNVKVPYLQHLPSYPANKSEDGWYEFDESTYKAKYSSLTGIVLSGLKRDLRSNMTIESSYFNLSCEDPEFFQQAFNIDQSGGYGGFEDWLGNVTFHNNKSQPYFVPDPTVETSFDPYSSPWNSFLIDTNYNYTDLEAPIPEQLILKYASKNASDYMISAYSCTIGLTYVEADLACDGERCRVRRMRPSQKVTAPSNETPLAVDYDWRIPGNPGILAEFLPWFTTATGISRGGPGNEEISPTDFFVAGYDYAFQAKGSTVNFRKVSGQDLAERLGCLINTAWQISLQGPATAQPAVTDASALKLGFMPGGPGYTAIQTTMTTNLTQEVYSADLTWVGLTIAISLLLLACGVGGLCFKYVSDIPDILGYVSTMTRDNPYFIPHHQSRLSELNIDRLDGLERARVFGGEIVQIANVKPGTEDGYIALRSVPTQT